MEASDRLKVFCGNSWVMGKDGYLGNKTGTERVGEFGDILGETSAYPNFGHLLDALMGSVSKALMDELRGYIVDHDQNTQ